MFNRLVFLSFIFIQSLTYSMHLDRVILSTDNNSTYIDFWPLAAKAWKEVVGVKPTLALIADDSVEIDESLGDVIRFKPIAGVSNALYAQVIRLLLPAYFPNEVCIVSDIDLIPLQKEYFFNYMKDCLDSSFVVFRDKAYQGTSLKQYPMCYLAGRGSTFQKIFELESTDKIEEKVKEWHNLSFGWNTDEKVVFLSTEKHKLTTPIRFLGHTVTKRIDRLDWQYKNDLVTSLSYIDAHLPRPYSNHRAEIDKLAHLIFSISKKPRIGGLDPQKINEWQNRDDDGSVFPWFTNLFLKEFKKWDMSNWSVLEYGSGYSTPWLANHCKELVTIEGNIRWAKRVKEELEYQNLKNVTFKLRNTETYIQKKEVICDYIKAVDEDDKLYDCIIIDGAYRNECALRAINHIKPGGIIILDNSNQATCEIDSSPIFELFKEFEHHSFSQDKHPDWKTDYWIAKKTEEKQGPLSNEQKHRLINDPVNDPDLSYGTHIHPLTVAVLSTKGPVLEMGCGDASTPILHALCAKDKRLLLSVDTDKKWIGLFTDLKRSWHHFQYIPCFDNDWDKNPKPQLWNYVGKDMEKWSVVFIDHRPGERRVQDIKRFKNQAEIIVVHDTEQPTYNYEPVLSSFKYRYDYERYKARTTLVSNFIDLKALFK